MTRQELLTLTSMLERISRYFIIGEGNQSHGRISLIVVTDRPVSRKRNAPSKSQEYPQGTAPEGSETLSDNNAQPVTCAT